jgi:hypothetical protein
MPIVIVIATFQLLVLQQAVPNAGTLLLGTLFVVIGLALFVRGLEMGLFPIGESMAYAFARKGSLSWLLVFAFALGFGTTVAEPALIAVAARGRRGRGRRPDDCQHHGGQRRTMPTVCASPSPSRWVSQYSSAYYVSSAAGRFIT